MFAIIVRYFSEQSCRGTLRLQEGLCLRNSLEFREKMAITSGDEFSLVVMENGDLFGFGVNDTCQLGLGHCMNQAIPVLIDRNIVFNGYGVVMASCGDSHAACVIADGSMYTWGNGQMGQLGFGDAVWNSRVPRRHGRGDFGCFPVLMVACGHDFTLVLTGEGCVWSSGDGRYGQLGHGNHKETNVFRRIQTVDFDGECIGMIAAGTRHSMALGRHGGRVWTWGANEYGHLGQGNWKHSSSTPLLVAGKVLGGGDFNFIDAGCDFSMAVTTGGALWACGKGRNGELGMGYARQSLNSFQCVWDPVATKRAGVRMVACGFSHTIAVTKDNAVWVCGSGGTWSGTESVSDVPIGNAIFKRIDPACFHGQDVQIVAAGSETSMAVTAQGRVYLWGEHSVNPDCFQRLLAQQVDPLRNLYQERWRPTLVSEAVFVCERVGQWHIMGLGHILAVCMGRHARLGHLTIYGGIDDEIFRIILGAVQRQTSGGTAEGFQQMIGFVSL